MNIASSPCCYFPSHTQTLHISLYHVYFHVATFQSGVLNSRAYVFCAARAGFFLSYLSCMIKFHHRHQWFYSHCKGPWPTHTVGFVSLRHLVDSFDRVISPSQRPLPTHGNNTTPKRRQTSMPRAVFEPTIPVTKRPVPAYAL
jgi:hypothetical protein